MTINFGGHSVLSSQGNGFKALAHYVQDFFTKLKSCSFQRRNCKKIGFFVGLKVMGLKVNFLVKKHFKDLLGYNETSGMYGR
jgi:hypothetical protein